MTGDNTPASISREWINEVLRKRIGYRGLIVSDDLEMGGVLAAGKVGEVAVACIRAGADMFLVCHKEDLVREAVEAVVRTAEHDRHFARRVHEAASRVLRYKARRAELLRKPSPRPTTATVGSLRRKIETLQERVRMAGGR
ncbi:MAG: hypothetical protein HYX26_07335 [Acidobacteriales bacterium]|nr:hypothetical protein [Terriglobales bacterium]